MYELEITRRAKRDFRRLSKEQQQRIWKAIQALAVHPRPAGCKRLVSDDALYRIRVGNYRILYTVVAVAVGAPDTIRPALVSEELFGCAVVWE